MAVRIRTDQVDVLFDLAGHTGHNRLLVFARRAAPIQITWAGYVGTTGLRQMDFLLADRFHVPEGFEKDHVEQILRMPDDYICFAPPSDAPPVTRLPSLSQGYVTFGAMANPAKVNAPLLELWSRVLLSVPDSRLLLCPSGWTDAANQARVREVLSQSGLQHRVDFDYQAGQLASLKKYSHVDIALDTAPYSGGLTTCEALWMGVPTVTLPGQRFCSRHSLSHLTNAGFPQFVAENAEDYVRIVVQLAENPRELEKLRASLREMVATSPLCDGARFARNFARVIGQAIQAKSCSSTIGC